MIGETLDSIANVLGVAGSITTLVSLAALSLLIAYLLTAQWLRGKSNAARQAIARSDDPALARLLGGTAVPLDLLSPEQKFTLATEELRTRSRQRIIAHALLFFGFLALLGFALGLAFFSSPAPPELSEAEAKAGQVQRVDVLSVLEILRVVPPAERVNACLRLLSQAECTRAAPLI